MKRIALTLLPVLGLVGCGTLPAPASGPVVRSEAFDDGIDYAKMARADQAARQHGVLLVWINPPHKAVTSGS